MRTRWSGGNRLGVRARTGSRRGRRGEWKDHRRGKHSRRRGNQGWARRRSKNRELGPCELRWRRQRVASVEWGGFIKHHVLTAKELPRGGMKEQPAWGVRIEAEEDT